MIRSQEIALRCAKAMNPNLLRHRQKMPENERADAYGLKARKRKLLAQLDGCQSNEARRLILGRSR